MKTKKPAKRRSAKKKGPPSVNDVWHELSSRVLCSCPACSQLNDQFRYMYHEGVHAVLHGIGLAMGSRSPTAIGDYLMSVSEELETYMGELEMQRKPSDAQHH